MTGNSLAECWQTAKLGVDYENGSGVWEFVPLLALVEVVHDLHPGILQMEIGSGVDSPTLSFCLSTDGQGRCDSARVYYPDGVGAGKGKPGDLSCYRYLYRVARRE